MNIMKKITGVLVYEYICIIIGSFLMAFAVKAIFDAMNIITGGVTGIAIIVKDLTRNINILGDRGVPLWATNILINIPLFVCAGYIKGRKMFVRSLVSTIFVSIFLGIIPSIHVLPSDNLLNAIVGGLIMGIGLGLVFISSATTGGTDLLAAMINVKIRHLSVPVILLCVDSVIVAAGAFTFGIEKALYSGVAIYVSTRITEAIMDGPLKSKMAYIISDYNKNISKDIMSKLDRGMTSVDVVGVYTNRDKTMLICVVGKKEIVRLKEIVKEYDSNAFVIISDVVEALGEGFINSKI